MKVDVKELAKWLADLGLEYPYSCDWPTDKNDSAVLWEHILRKRFGEERKFVLWDKLSPF